MLLPCRAPLLVLGVGHWGVADRSTAHQGDPFRAAARYPFWSRMSRLWRDSSTLSLGTILSLHRHSLVSGHVAVHHARQLRLFSSDARQRTDKAQRSAQPAPNGCCHIRKETILGNALRWPQRAGSGLSRTTASQIGHADQLT